jgi:hypothetical protein
MPSQINRVPFGFLSLLDSQNMGRNPSVLGDGVQATVEMRPFWVQDAQRVAHGAASVVSPNESAILTVPQNEVWDLLNIGGIASPAINATATLRFALKLETKSTTAASGRADALLATGPESQPVYQAAGAARFIYCCWTAPQPMFAGPGDIIRAEVADILLGGLVSIPIQVRVWYRRYVIA